VGKRSDFSRTGSVGREACASRKVPKMRSDSGAAARAGSIESWILHCSNVSGLTRVHRATHVQSDDVLFPGSYALGNVLG